MSMVGKLLIPTVLMTAGCVSVATYPQEWPEAETAIGRKCPDISGEYSEVSDPVQLRDPFGRLQDPPISISLRSILVDRKISEIRKRKSRNVYMAGDLATIVWKGVVVIKQGEDILDVSYIEYSLDPITAQKTEQPQARIQIDYSCTPDGVHIAPHDRGKFSGGHVYIAGVTSWDKTEITLIKLADGSLAANKRQIGAGVVLIAFILPVPGYASGNDWLRWRKAEGN